MTALEILKGAREFLADERRWTQESFGRYVDGKVCNACLDGALRYIATGAPHGNIDGTGAYAAYRQATRRLQQAIGLAFDFFPVWDFNDHKERKHHEILEVLDKAIAAEETINV